MFKKIKQIILIIILLVLAFLVLYFITNKEKTTVEVAKNVSQNEIEDEELKSLINISDCSEEFMDNYFKDMKSIQTNEEKENMLIVISSSKIGNTFGAKKIIEAPNNQYFLQYENKEMKDNAYAKLSEDDSLYSVEENGYYTIETETFNSWGIEKMALDYAIESTEEAGPNDVTVAIIDTGCDVELANKYYPGKIKETYNVLKKSTDLMSDENGHGTHVFGTIAEGTPSNVKIIPVKVLGSDGRGSWTDIITAVNYITYNDKADVINMSLGGYGYNQALEQAIESAKQKNIISVAAAGNNNTSSNHYPSALNNTISIASIDSDLNKSSFSNYGSKITFTAPGTNIKSIMGKNTTISKQNGNNEDDEHETISGTSMATPHAVSAVAILKSYNKNLTLDNIIELLKKHAVDLGEQGWDKYYGYGLISFNNAQFREGENVDEYGVFKRDYENEENTITRIEIPYILLTDYNYWSINNLFNTPIKLYYNETEYNTKKLGELEKDGLEIIGYAPDKQEEQEIQIKYAGFTLNETVPYPDNLESGWEYTILNETDIELTLYKGNANNFETLYIPEKIDNYNVVSLAGNSDLKSKVFGNALDFYSFKEIVLPKTLTNLGRASLMGGKYEKITSLADSIVVGEYAFLKASSLKEFNGLISELGEKAFSEATSIDNIVLSDDITVIPDYAFSLCTNLEHINIPQNITYIGPGAFVYTKINSIVIPSGVTKIEKDTFSNCSNMESITFSENLTEIDEDAFIYTNIRELYIPKNLTNIDKKAFFSIGTLEKIVVDEENPIYDSRDNCNAIIETSTNTVLRASNNTVIPQNVTKIGYGAYSGAKIDNLSTSSDEYSCMFTVPEHITDIEDYAFFESNFNPIKLGRNVSSISNNDLVTSKKSALFLVYSDSYAKEFCEENGYNYRHINPDIVDISLSKKNYRVFESIDTTDMYAALLYLEDERRIEIYSDINEFNIEYEDNNRDYFIYGDTHITVSFYSSAGEYIEKQVKVTVTKATAEYIIPDDITAKVGQKLSEIELPNGFEWMDGDIIIDEIGSIIYKARYVPTDTNNYEIEENIDITVLVEKVKNVINPNITIESKTYDGTTDISLSDINISGLESTDYTIVSAISSSANVGERTATIKLRLTDEKFGDYSFDNGEQEKEFTVEFNILKANLGINDLTRDLIVKYDGEPHTINVNIENDDETILRYMDENEEYTLEEPPQYLEIGTYTIKYKVYIDDNYTEYFGEKTLTITEEDEYLLGDVDNNGTVNTTDCTIILRYLKGYQDLTPVQLLAADANRDGTVNTTDCTIILRYLKGYQSLD